MGDENRDAEMLINRISEALQVHAALESSGAEDLSILPISQDTEEGWLDVAVHERDEFGTFGETRILRIEVKITDDYKPRTRKGD